MSLLNSTKSLEVDLDIYQDKALQVSVSKGVLAVMLVLLKDQVKEFEADGQSPEAITASQRACEVQIRDWVESQGVVITR